MKRKTPGELVSAQRRNIWRAHEGGKSFREIEADPKFGLKERHGLNAMRVCQAYGKTRTKARPKKVSACDRVAEKSDAPQA